MRRVAVAKRTAVAAVALSLSVLILLGASAEGAGPAGALQFNGSSQYVTFGAAPGLGAATFTLETWFKRTGAGVGTSTGSGGIASAIPLVTKGRAEAEGSNVDMNYFLGIDTATMTFRRSRWRSRLCCGRTRGPWPPSMPRNSVRSPVLRARWT